MSAIPEQYTISNIEGLLALNRDVSNAPDEFLTLVSHPIHVHFR
jgi:hypothetical protein